MYTGQTVFAQLMQLAPREAFGKAVRAYQGNRGVRSFPCWSQFLCMAYAQLTGRSSLRDIETCLNAHPERLYHMGFRGTIARSTLAEANENRDFRIYSHFARCLIAKARALYRDEELAVELDQTVYALDSTTIDLCLALFPWARFRKTKGAVKMHTLLDLRGAIPAFVTVSTGKLHDVNVLDVVPLEAESIVTMDRAYVDFRRLYTIHRLPAYFVVRAKRNMLFRRLRSAPVDKSAGVRADQSVMLKTTRSREFYPEALRRVVFYDTAKARRLVFLTNHFDIPAPTVAEIYR